MIKTETVLTATPVVLEKVPDNYSLHENVGPVIKGLDEICMSSAVYDMNNIAVSLPVATGEDSQHEIIMSNASSTIAGAVRHALSAIKTYVIPSCDKIEQAIKSIGGVSTTEDLMFAKLFLNFVHISDEFFTSPIFPDSADEGYESGILFDSSHLTKLGEWPTLNYVEILDLIPEASNYPELTAALSDSDAVELAWSALGKPAFWLGTVQLNLNPKNVEVTSHLKALIVLTLLVNKFAASEDPVKGVLGISLDDYRSKIQAAKRFLNSVLYYTRRRLTYSMAAGIMFIDKEVKFEECTDDQSQFFGTTVLNGGCKVLYNDTVANYFATSSEYSLSEVIIGMLVAEVQGVKPRTAGFLDSVPFYQQLANGYVKDLSTAVVKNLRISTKKTVTRAIHDLANSPLWSEYLSDNGKYKNLAYRLEDLIRDNGGIIEPLSLLNTSTRIREGSLSVANTNAAVVLAKAIGSPIAAEILANNMSNEPLSLEQQRKMLAKAISRFVVQALIKR